MTDLTKLVDQYLRTWNETDATARRKAIEQLWTPTGRYVDPLVDARGTDAIDATIAAAQGQFAGLTFTLHGDVDTHHDVARFQWSLGPDGAEPLAIGFDVLATDEGGRIATVVGFLDKVPG